MGTWRRALPLIGWMAALLTGIALFHAMGRGVMAPPPVTDPGAWADWAGAREPAVVVAAVGRLVVLALAWYLVGVTTVGLVARLVRLAGLIRVADALTLPMVRRLLRGALGVGLATAMVGAATTPLPREAPAPAWSVAQEAGEAVAGEHEVTLTLTGAEEEVSPPVEAGPVAMRLAAQEDDAQVGLRQVSPSDDGVGPAVGLRLAGEEDQAVAPGPGSHLVVAGESLWSISQDALARAWQREPTELEVHDYWRRTTELNRDRLADPENPDLIFPGDEVQLPVPHGQDGT